jgi:hypothetical protein
MCVISTTTNSVLIGSVGLGHAHAGVASLKRTHGMTPRVAHHQQSIYMPSEFLPCGTSDER